MPDYCGGPQIQILKQHNPNRNRDRYRNRLGRGAGQFDFDPDFDPDKKPYAIGLCDARLEIESLQGVCYSPLARFYAGCSLSSQRKTILLPATGVRYLRVINAI
jgi:hypothetical protein